MSIIHIETEIEASPEEVRAVVLDFARYPEWQQNFPKSIILPPGKSGLTLTEGDRLHAEFVGASIQPIVLSNTPSEFRWQGNAGPFGAWAAIHYWKFTESEKVPGTTTFIHGEEYVGWGKIMFRPGWPGWTIATERFGTYNQELKGRVEGFKGKWGMSNASEY